MLLSLNLFVSNSEKALYFYEKALNAVSIESHLNESAGLRSARFTIDDHLFAIADENPTFGSKSPNALNGVPMCIQLFVDDLPLVIKRMLTLGCDLVAPSTHQKPIFKTATGIEFSNVKDPFGFVWSLTQKKPA